mgnify:CR=1 FL=1
MSDHARMHRRTLLRGTAVALGLPLLEAMSPAARQLMAAEASKPPVRMVMPEPTERTKPDPLNSFGKFNYTILHLSTCQIIHAKHVYETRRQLIHKSATLYICRPTM